MLYAGGIKQDSLTIRTGFRTFEVRGSRFYLNGQPYFLRGANNPSVSSHLNDSDVAYKYSRLMKEGNQNVTRFHHLTPGKCWFDACDETGMLVMWEGMLSFSDHPFWSPRFWAQIRKEYTAVIKKLSAHPSVVIWSLGNENALSSRDRSKDFEPGQEVVAYCRGPHCILAFDAVAQLRGEGLQARRLENGFPEWKVAGLPVEDNLTK